MINKYKADRSLKEYKVSKVKTGTAKNDGVYTVFSIADAKQVNGAWKYDNYSVFSWQENLDLQDGDKIKFKDIEGIEVKEDEYNGNKTIKKTIFATVEVIPGDNHQVKQPEIVDNGLGDLDDLESGLPF